MTVALTALPDLLGTSPADLIGASEHHDSTPDEARQRAERLRAGIVRYSEMRQDIADAFACRDWIALGYDNWPAYVEGEFGEQLAQLGRGERRQAVADLRGQGMSVRQIASATGMPRETVRRDVSGDPNGSPEKVTGSDGKKYASTRPTPTPGPVGAATETPPVGPGTTPAPAVEPPTSSVAPQEPAPVPDPLVAVAAMATTPDPQALVAAALSSPAAPKPTLTLVPTDHEKRAAVQRDARGLLRRVVEILAPDHDPGGFVETWARQLGPYDDELSDLIRRANNALAALDDLISEAGK